MDEKAQVSIELVLVLAAIVALVLMLVSQMQATGTKAADKLEGTSKDIFEKIGKIK